MKRMPWLPVSDSSATVNCAAICGYRGVNQTESTNQCSVDEQGSAGVLMSLAVKLVVRAPRDLSIACVSQLENLKISI